MYAPAQHDEITTLMNYLDEQLAAVRAAPYGLTEEQARQRPCRSALSIGGIVKHLGYGMQGWIEQFHHDSPSERPLDFTAHAASFALAEDETMSGVLAGFDARRAELLSIVPGLDPAARAEAPPAPWFGIDDARPIRLRYQLWHLVEESARHAGHADIIREELDGVSVSTLVMTHEGVRANNFFQPFQAPPGSITD